MRTKTNLFAVGMIVLCFAVFLLVSVAIGETANPELGKFQGTWTLAWGEADGKKIAEVDVSNNKIVYQGSQGQLTSPHQSAETIFFDIVKVDPTKSPKEFTLIRKTGPNAGKTITAIYEFDGNDQFKFAFDPKGVTTPKDFSTKEGSGHILHVWKRAKP